MEQLERKINTAIHESEVDAVIAFGVDNFNYLTHTVLPFAEYYPMRKAAALIPKVGTPAILCPYDWGQPIEDQGWKGDLHIYDENTAVETGAFVECLVEHIQALDLNGRRVGYDASRITKALMNSLSNQLPEVEWESVDPMLRDLRLVKTSGEIGLIEEACLQADRGIVYALMHLEGAVDNPGYSIPEFTERIRVHINENGASGVGLLNTAFGSDGQIYYTPQRGWVKSEEIFRMDVSCHYKGYWTNMGRMGVTGNPSTEQEVAFQENTILKNSALEMLKPGVACNEVYAHVVRAAERQTISFWKDVGIGHGVGTSHYEPPYLNLSCSTELKQGMVIALDIYTYGPRQELIHNKDVYEITEEGNKKLSWYRSWDELYPVTGWRATH
jgi:Xaa-Pro aminopeptidase